VANEPFDWYYAGDTGQVGPLSETQLLDLAEHAVIKRDTLVWKAGMSNWVPAESVPKIAARMQPVWTPPPVAAPPPLPNQPRSTAGPGRAGSGIVCPRDGTSLRHDHRSGVEIDFCPTCRGVWLDRGELDKLIKREASDRRHYDDDDDDDRRGRKRKGGFLSEVFDIFD
jgi:uncharacterized protein